MTIENKIIEEEYKIKSEEIKIQIESNQTKLQSLEEITKLSKNLDDKLTKLKEIIKTGNYITFDDDIFKLLVKEIVVGEKE